MSEYFAFAVVTRFVQLSLFYKFSVQNIFFISLNLNQIRSFVPIMSIIVQNQSNFNSFILMH